MSMKISPPQFSNSKAFERYKQELLAWREVTELGKKKQGIALALSLPEEEESGIRAQVFDELSLDELKEEDGFEKFIAFLEGKLGKDELEDCLEKFEDFEDFQRMDTMTINDYIAKFDSKYRKIQKKGMTLPSEILAFKLLRRANISREEKLLVMTGMDYSAKSTLYDQAKKSLKKFKGDSTSVGDCMQAMKLEPTYHTEKETFVTVGGGQRRWYPNKPNRGTFGGRQGTWRPSNGRSLNNQTDRPVNPNGVDGRPLTCRACGSFRHLLRQCPHSWENMQTKNKVYQSEESEVLFIEEKVVMFTGYDKSEIQRLGIESRNCAVLDTACTSTVCGQQWFNCFIGTLSAKERDSIKQFPGSKIFKFGGGEQLKSLKCVHLPCVLAGKEVTLETDIVSSDIPLLLSLKSLKGAHVKLDLEQDEAEIFGTKVPLNFTSSGHYCVPVDKACETPVEYVNSVDLDYKSVEKLHKQFVHPPKKKLITLIKDAGAWKENLIEDIDKIYQSCQTCKQYAKTPARPVVSMPMAKGFNEKVAMDLKVWKDGKYILHMVDMFSRLSVSVFVQSKQPKEIVDKVMKHWVAVWGLMKYVMFDNGGEFSNSEMREVTSILNVEVYTTPAESPWSNGLCERNHQVTDRMLEILEDENPRVHLSTLLAWANMAKNSLQMWNGFSSFQIVLGKNPELPNIVTGKLPSLQGSSSSEILVSHLNALHSARRAFVQCECDEKIRRALRHQVRAVDEIFYPGDKVFYKREGCNKWLGPGKVIFQDGRLVFVRHGGVYVRVSTNRLIKDCSNHVNDIPTLDIIDDGKVDPTTIESRPNVQNNEISEEIGVNDVNTDRQENQPVKLKANDKIKYRLPDSDNWTSATVISRAGKASGRNRNYYNVKVEDSGEQLSVDLGNVEWEKAVEEVNVVLIPVNRHGEEECIKAKNDELEKLRQFDTYEEVDDDGQSRISTRWVLSLKGEQVKARLVARGFEETTQMQKDSPTLGKSTLKTFLAVAASKKWKVSTTDIKSAFLQGKQLERDVYLKPPPEANVCDGKIWKLKHCLYGLNDAARQFYNSVKEELIKLGCVQSKLDPALFFLRHNGKLTGMIGCHIDDFLHAGEIHFDRTVMDKLRNRFLAGKMEDTQFTYVGFGIKQTDESIILDQSEYMKELEYVNQNRASQKHGELNQTEQSLLRSQVGRINWAVQGSRPDLGFEMIELSTKLKKGNVSDLQRANKAIKRLKDEQNSNQIVFPCLGDLEQCKIMVFSDASHANLSDGVSSVGAHVVLLVGSDRNCCPLAWQANKIKRVVRSTIAAEALSLQEGLENGFYLRTLLEELLALPAYTIQLEAYVDNRSVIEAIHSTKLVDDKRLRLDISAMKESLNLGQVHSVRWCPSEFQIANCMTKRGASGHHLLSVMQIGKIDFMY